ncbi:MAG: hypothetical protein C0518_08250 [Opitutus sp.]|nr:hypothetical protein [Opitutus sp.]
MNFQKLLQQRDALLRQARLANVAFAYQRLRDFADRLERAGIAGALSVHPANPEADRFMPTLVAHASHQSVIDEHFLDEDVADLADILRFLSQEDDAVEFTFDAGQLEHNFLPLLRRELERAGVTSLGVAPPTEDSRHASDWSAGGS